MDLPEATEEEYWEVAGWDWGELEADFSVAVVMDLEVMVLAVAVTVEVANQVVLWEV